MKRIIVLLAVFALAAAIPAGAFLDQDIVVTYQGITDIYGIGITSPTADAMFYVSSYCGVPGVGSCGVYSVLFETSGGYQVTVDLYFDDYGNLIGFGATAPDGVMVIVPESGIPLGLPTPQATYVGPLYYYIYQNGALAGVLGPYETEVSVSRPSSSSVEWKSPSYSGTVTLKTVDVEVVYYANGTRQTLIYMTYAPEPGAILSLYIEDLVKLYNPIIYSDNPPPGTTQAGTTTTIPPEETLPTETAGPVPVNETGDQPQYYEQQLEPDADIAAPDTTEGDTGDAILGLLILALVAGGGVLVGRRLSTRRKPPAPPTPAIPAPPARPPAVPAQPPPARASLASQTVHAAPGATLQVQVDYSCPAGCTLQLVPPPGTGIGVQPPSARVQGVGTLPFTIQLPPGARPGEYSLALLLDGRAAGSLGLYVLEPEKGEARELIPGYRLLAKLGAGGFSTVYLAERVEDGRRVAVKVPKVSFGETIAAGLVETFRREAETWSKLKHPNIVEVIDYGVKPVPYIAMEYMPGGSLRKRLAQGPLPVGEALRVALGVAEALSYAHHLGVIHRDIKPENVLFDDKGTPKLTDFGLAKVLLEASTTSAAGAFKGTLLYAAPEQIDPQAYGQPDWRTDIWQFGALLYETLTGRPPFQADSPLQLIQKIVSETPPPPSSLNPQVPAWLDEIVVRSLAKRKEDRWRSIDVIIERIRSHTTP